MNLWQWIELLGRLQTETSDAPTTLAISSGQLLAVLVAILHDDFKTKGRPQIKSSMLVQLLPGTGFFPCTKLEQALDGLQYCKFKSSSGQAWISAMFHLQYLLVLLSHANIASADAIRYLTHGHYLRTDSLYSKRRFLQSIISLPFKCQLIDFALKESFTALYKDNARGWIGWKCLKDGHLKVDFEQMLAFVMKRIAPNVKVQLEVRVTRNSQQINSETANLVHAELEHHIRMLHMLMFSYFFYRSKTHHPTNQPDHYKDLQLSPIMDELRTSLHELGQSLPSVEKFLATSLKVKPTLAQQFSTLLENFPFSPIYIDQLIVD
ncbi:hypothetical protein DSO57_1004305 [Entomophthora muscae]|uniref:Uncharacterized protein n=1 Tax=Entomophthora muscae TaxID=34485 RepID=A0ACC2TVY1_9FUNG|nr:hypothetical protein DSO57_1004305 [Entomophthora muscae]